MPFVCRAVSLIARSFVAAAVVNFALVVGAEAQVKRVVDGRVVRPVRQAASAKQYTPPVGATAKQADSARLANAGDDLVNVPDIMVTLHRVSKGGQGAPLDSARTNAAGHYHFNYAVTDTVDAIYFTSATYGGVAYFTVPLRGAVTTEHDGEITVFDTTSRALPLAVAGRHLIVSAVDTSTDERTIVEVFELSNDSIFTIVSAGTGKSTTPTWTVSIPPDARKFKAGEGGDISPAALTFEKGRVSLFAPMAPGVKQLSFSYHLPTKSFPLSYALDHGANVFEVLLEEALGTATGAGVVIADPVSLENRNFRRFLAQNVADGAPLMLTLPSGPPVGRNIYIAALLGTIGIIMLLILLRAMQRRQPIIYGNPIINVRPPDVPMADKLAREIADLDATFARSESPSEALRAAYDTRRAELKDALAAEIARR